MPSKFTRRAACVVLAASALSCSDDKKDTFGAGQEGAVYMVNTTVFGTEGESLTYFAPLSGLTADATFDRTKSLEAPGMAKLYARDGLGWFAVGSGEEPSVTRYALDEAGEFVKGDSISFQPRGTTFLADTMVFVSDEKAYYFDAPNDQLIRWNPKEMTVDGVIDLVAGHKEGLITSYDLKPLLRDDGVLVFPVAWRNFESGAVFNGTGLFAIDTREDRVLKYSESERCQGITWSTTLANGDMYAATTPFFAVRQRLTGEGPASCVLRVRAGENEFDPDYHVDLAELVGGRLAGGLARGREGQLYFRAMEPDVAVDENSDVDELWSGAYWRWQRWDLDSNSVESIDALPPSGAGGLTYDVDGHTYATDSAADWSSTTLIDLTAEDGPAAALSAPGYIYGVVRVR